MSETEKTELQLAVDAISSAYGLIDEVVRLRAQVKQMREALMSAELLMEDVEEATPRQVMDSIVLVRSALEAAAPEDKAEANS